VQLVAERVEFRSHRAIACDSATSGVGDPVLAAAIDGADSAVADHKSANIALRLADMLLNIMDVMLIGA